MVKKNKSYFKRNKEYIGLFSIIMFFISYVIWSAVLAPTGSLQLNYFTVSISSFLLIANACNFFILPFLIESLKVREEILKFEWKFIRFMFPSYLIVTSLFVMLIPTFTLVDDSLKFATYTLTSGIWGGLVFIFIFQFREFGKMLYKSSKNVGKIDYESKELKEEMSIIFHLITTYSFGMFIYSCTGIIFVLGFINTIFI
ncbi:MAG: hypothetical protein KAT28_01865 [Candidatus Aenigmarchaeota archaeon]|nr:hypothetical protein [Candidatus Aenigmarchaeota archaeon]